MERSQMTAEGSSMSPAAQFFIDKFGQPLIVFVEASSVLQRPKLIRTLRNAGATISREPAEAQVILVDPVTDAGTKFVTDWGSDPGKVVLDSVWVRRSQERGKPLLADEDWGGLRVQGGEEPPTNGMDYEHPLPTPRQTPPDATHPNQTKQNHSIGQQQQSQEAASASHPFSSFSSQQGINSPSLLIPSQSSQYQPPSARHPMQHLVDPSAQATAQLVVPMNLLSTIYDSIRLSGFNPAQFPAYASQFPSPMPMGVFPSPLMTTNFAPPGSVSTSFPNFSQSPNSQNLVATNLAPVSTPMSSTPGLRDAAAHHSLATQDHMDVSTPPSLKKRKSTLSETPPLSSSRSKGKGRATSDERPFKHPRRSTPRGSASPAPSSRRVSGTPRRPGEVFKHTSGESMQIVVQVDLRHRIDIVGMIKKNGGRIISEIPQADYVVLYHNSKSFRDLYQTCVTFGRPAVQASFIRDCVERGALLDEEAYSFDDVLPKRKGGRLSTVDSPLAKLQTQQTPKSEKSRVKQERIIKSEERKWKGKQKEKEKSVSPLLDSTHRRPSPPPPSKVVQFAAGKNVFTLEEQAYVAEYVPILLERDPELSQTEISKRLTQKMPSHPERSWQAHIQKRRDEMDVWKKKAWIAFRKRQAAARSRLMETSPPPPESPIPSGMSDPLSGSQHPEVTDQPVLSLPLPASDDFKNDFKAISDFFAHGGADSRSDEEVWLELGKLYPNRNAEGWQDFWSEYGEDVNAEVQRLAVVQQQGVAVQQQASVAQSFEPPLKTEPV